VTLAVCAGLQILGSGMTDVSGFTHAGAGILDIETRPRRVRAVGEIVTNCAIPGVGKLCGFENHRGGTTLGAEARPLGVVRSGIGNGDQRVGRRQEGVYTDRIIGTYLHGPVLARNPALADHLLSRATGRVTRSLDVPDQAALRDTYL
jgi:hypothetical protein